jgi:hypothetical protein
MTDPARILAGTLVPADLPVPPWARDHLWIALWDRDQGPDQVIARTQVTGPEGAFRFALGAGQLTDLALTGHRPGPHHLVSLGWGEALAPLLTCLPWPEDWAERERLDLCWDHRAAQIGFVEQMHCLEVGTLPVAVLELAGYPLPFTYRRLPPLPLPASGDRHGLHTDRRLDDAEEQITYFLVGAESPLASIAQDALVSQLRVVAVGSLGRQSASWHDLVNLPLVLEELTLIAP